MDEATLVRRLEGLFPPGMEAARERAALAAGAGFDAAPLVSRSGLTRRPAPGLALAVALLIVLATALTPAGQAAAGWVGERVGIGDPGGQPTLETLRHAWHAGEDGGGPAYVLADGPEPQGGHYELVTYRQPGEAAPCLELDLTAARSGYGGLGCEPLTGDLQATWGGNADPDQAIRYVAGRVSDDVDSVRVEFGGRPVPVELTAVPKSLAGRVGIDRPFKFFIGFSDDMGTGRFEVSARDAAGRQLAHESLEAIAVPAVTPAQVAELTHR